MPTEGEDGVGIGPIHLNRNRIHPFGLPPSQQIVRRRPESVDPSTGGRRGVVPFQQPLKICLIQDTSPSLDQPLRMRPAHGGILQLQLIEGLSAGVFFTGHAAQHRVDKATLRRKPALTGQQDRLVHHRVIGDPVEEQQLVQSHLQDAPKDRALRPPIGARGDNMVQGRAVAQDTESDFLRQTPVSIGKGLQARDPLQSVLKKIPRLTALKKNLQHR